MMTETPLFSLCWYTYIGQNNFYRLTTVINVFIICTIQNFLKLMFGCDNVITFVEEIRLCYYYEFSKCYFSKLVADML